MQTYIAGILWRGDDGGDSSIAKKRDHLCAIDDVHSHCDVIVCRGAWLQSGTQQCGQHFAILKVRQLLHSQMTSDRAYHISTRQSNQLGW